VHRISGRWRLGLALALLTTVCWGVLPIALKLMLGAMDIYTITWYRFLIASIVLGAILAGLGRLPLGAPSVANRWLLLIALLGLVGNYLLYLLALDYTTPGITQVVGQLAPACLLLGGLIVFRERFSPPQWLGFAVLIAGILLFFNRRLEEFDAQGSRLTAGVLLVVLASIVWTGYALAQKQLLRSMSSQQILWLLYVAATLLLLPVAAPATLRDLTGPQLGLLLFCSANTLIAYGALAEALEHWEVSRVSAVLALAPLFTLSGMWLIERVYPDLLEPEGLNAVSILGALVVVSGSALCALATRESKRAGEPRPPEPPGV
jgi:drug/metabolite transporter (DMT)-like permease